MIVIDDVHKFNQFEALIPFASDLRIIVTSRDWSLLKDVVGRTNLDHHKFDVPTLESHESNMLFLRHAFNSDKALEGYQELASNVVDACGGLPLALKVIGSILFDKRDNEARDTIWQETSQGDVLIESDVIEVLRWSYDSLSESEKLMFLDITCLFHDKCTKDLALAVWESCEVCISCGGVETPRSSLRTLADKCLLSFDLEEVSFKVHKLLVVMGKAIAKKDGRHFVKGKFASVVATDKQGTKKTRALNLVGSRKRKFEAEDFINMPNLHFLELPDGCIVNGDFKCMPKELRWLRWRGMSFSHIPTNLDVSQLTSLDFSESTDMASLWIEANDNFEGCLNLRWLNLKDCTSITNLPDSIGLSSQLQSLNLMGCSKLKKLPKSIGQLEQLKYLYLSRCIRLKVLPDTLGQAFQLRSLELDNCIKLKKLPNSIGQLKELKNLNVCSCTSLRTLPDTIGALSNLQTLYAYNRTSLVELPISIRFFSCLRTLWSGANTECQTFSEGNIEEAWTQLPSLRLFDCHGLGSLLNYGALKSLEDFALHDNLTKLPKSIGLLICLQTLTIECERLQSSQSLLVISKCFAI